jgi:CHAT domain-containing protein/tetratricopeptide (TPR) repeat protein
MSEVSDEDFAKFCESLEQAYIRLGSGKVGLDTKKLKPIICTQKAAAYCYIEINCAGAAAQPGYLTTAMIIAAACQVEFGDDLIVEVVTQRAKELNAMAYIQGIGIAKDVASAKAALSYASAGPNTQNGGKNESDGDNYVTETSTVDVNLDLKQVVEMALSRQLSPSAVGQWVAHNKAKYRKRSWKEPGGLDAYLDWQDLATELARCITQLLNILYEHEIADEEKILLASIVYALRSLNAESLNRAKGAFAFGYTCWQIGEYASGYPAFEETINLLRGTSDDPIMLGSAMSYYCDCLGKVSRHDEVVTAAKELVVHASRHSLRGFQTLALRDLGNASAALGRKEEAFESLKMATDLRRQLSEEEVRLQSVIVLAAFLDSLGEAAKRAGYFDDAISAYQEVIEFHQTDSDWHLEAMATSELAYTYEQFGKLEEALRLLNKAVLIEEKCGETSIAKKWKIQLERMETVEAKQTTDNHKVGPSGNFVHETNYLIQDVHDASILAEKGGVLAQQGHYIEAVELLSIALKWADTNQHYDCQLVCRNSLAICFYYLERPKEAIAEYQQAVKLADKFGGAATSLDIRANLATVFYSIGDMANAQDVLENGIGFANVAIANSTSYAVRQQIVAKSLVLYEGIAFFVSQADAHNNHIYMAGLTEIVRAMHMGGWTRLQSQLTSEKLPSAVALDIEQKLLQLRALEVELDMRFTTDSLTASQNSMLRERCAALYEQIEKAARESDLALNLVADSVGMSGYVRDANETLSSILTDGDALLSLFSVSEGICFSIYYVDSEGVKARGGLIEWARQARLQVLTKWFKKTDFKRARSAFKDQSKNNGDATDVLSSTQCFEELRQLIEMKMLAVILPILMEIKPKKLAVMPHRELGLLPYWQLQDHCESIEAITLVPSLNILQICKERVRELSGDTVYIPDVTNTLEYTKLEEQCLQSSLPEVKTVTTLPLLMEVGPQTSLLHIAAHGTFDANIPYYTGFVIDNSAQQENELFALYGQLATDSEDGALSVSGQRQEDGYQLVTVASCMAQLSLRCCRLAIISSCECGLPDSHGSGELIGLPNSLIIAGAKSVIAALWPVDDAATAILMSRFYTHWQTGPGKEAKPSLALGLARNDLRKMNRMEALAILGWDADIPDGEQPFNHPIFYDAFHCFGDW